MLQLVLRPGGCNFCTLTILAMPAKNCCQPSLQFLALMNAIQTEYSCYIKRASELGQFLVAHLLGDSSGQTDGGNGRWAENSRTDLQPRLRRCFFWRLTNFAATASSSKNLKDGD
jgi:hypothetical protein